MRRVVSLCVVIFLVSFIVVGTAQPAGAQVIRLRHWWTTASPLQPGSPDGLGSPQRGPGTQNYLDSPIPGNIVWDSGLIGFSYRSRPMGHWLLSFTYDSGPMDNLMDTEGGFGSSPGTNRFWAANVHYLFTPARWPNAQFTVFAGYGGGSLNVSVPGGNRDLSTSGVQYGADVYVPFGGRWYVTGSATFGNWPIRHTLLGVPDLPEGMTSISDYSATLGKWLTPTVAAEVGWRSIYWTTGPLGSLTPCPCTMSWDGWYGGLTLRMP